MSLFTSLFSSKAPEQPSDKKELVYLMGIGSYKVEIPGDEHYQTALEVICGARRTHGVNCFETASLILDNKNAVRVEIRRKHVGYLNPEMASLFRQQLVACGLPRGFGQCSAVIRSGWLSSDGRKGPFKVFLDLPTWS